MRFKDEIDYTKNIMEKMSALKDELCDLVVMDSTGRALNLELTLVKLNCEGLINHLQDLDAILTKIKIKE